MNVRLDMRKIFYNMFRIEINQQRNKHQQYDELHCVTSKYVGNNDNDISASSVNRLFSLFPYKCTLYRMKLYNYNIRIQLI